MPSRASARIVSNANVQMLRYLLGCRCNLYKPYKHKNHRQAHTREPIRIKIQTKDSPDGKSSINYFNSKSTFYPLPIKTNRVKFTLVICHAPRPLCCAPVNASREVESLVKKGTPEFRSNTSHDKCKRPSRYPF